MELATIDNKVCLVFPEQVGFKPFALDLVSGTNKWRADRARHEKVVKALGQNPQGLKVLDATAGFLGDAWNLAAAGCRVTALEKNPTIFALAEDALERAGQKESEIRQRIQLKCMDSLSGVCEIQNSDPHEILYMDPMFVEPTKSLPSKEMQILQLLNPQSEDFAPLIKTALRCGFGRILVKRAQGALPVVPNPSGALSGKQIRFDIYSGSKASKPNEA